MAFERRKSAGLYYYAAARDPETGKVRKYYLGRGERAEAAAAEVALRRERRSAERRARREAREKYRAAERLTAELAEAAATLMQAALMALNWHRPNYGSWRKKRDGH